MRVLAAAGLLLLALAPAKAAPQRIVSINLCADPYLMAMADKAQIAALSPFSRDPSLAYYYRQAAAYPNVRSDAEAVLALKPDLVLGSPYLGLETRAMLSHFGVRMVDVGEVKNFSGIVAQTRAIAAVIGHPDRGEKLVGEMQTQLAAIAAPRTPPPLAVHYQRQGYVTGTGTLMDDVMKRAGLRNLAARLGDFELAHVDLEAQSIARQAGLYCFHHRAGRRPRLGCPVARPSRSCPCLCRTHTLYTRYFDRLRGPRISPGRGHAGGSASRPLSRPQGSVPPRKRVSSQIRHLGV